MRASALACGAAARLMKVGLLGTMVWDTIHARDVRNAPIEEWGGASYAFAAFAAAAPADWEVIPLVRVGSDLSDRALAFLHSMERLDLDRVRVVAEPNNRVELRYVDEARRSERLSGGVSPWPWPVLEALVGDLDALYVNFISGFEMELETAQRLRMRMHGPVYCDLHSLFLGVAAGGLRTPQPLDHWRDWLSCFDVVQLNEDELALLASAWGDPWEFAAQTVGDMPRALLVTLAERGAAYVASAAFRPDPLAWREPGVGLKRPLAVPGAVRSGKVEARDVVERGDPTGSGDVWGATCFARLLAGDALEDAMAAANEAGARNAAHRGATGLYDFLQGRIAK
ncbi:MAG TPA: carbohydrate kinase family protein [Longimicrobiales bacterium]|nr:carbohydrate kinase family protein [Longimicrobiales bacterium]